MNKPLIIESIKQLMHLFGEQNTLHPLITIIDFSSISDYKNFLRTKIFTELYAIMLKQQCNTSFKYGREEFDFQEGSLIFVAPGQVIEIEDKIENTDTKDWGIFFHPSLLIGNNLNQTIKEYSFFSYSNNEALHVSSKEKENINLIIEKLKEEMFNNIDKHSQTLIVSNIELLLNYCKRYYERQFITRVEKSSGILKKVEETLNNYYNSEQVKLNGTITVTKLANDINMSSNYMSDLLKKETGLSAMEHIHKFVIKEAKKKLLVSEDAIGEIAYDLGFEYPQYFTRLFKKETGNTPKEFRNRNLK